MSILDDEDVVIQRTHNHVTSRINLPNAQRGELKPIEYAKMVDVYAHVITSYVDFFIKYWMKDDVCQTNKLMTEELERVGLYGWKGLTEAECNPLGEYVMSLDCPATLEEMKIFFKRVIMGDLEFRNRYPIESTNAFDMIKELEISI